MLKDVTIEYDEDSMTMSYNDIKITFNYNDGIVSYIADENITDEEMVSASLYQSFVLQAFFDKFDYDYEKVNEYLEKNSKLKIDEDGFEYILQEFSYKDENGSISGEFFSTLKFDLINGLKNYSEKSYVDEKIPEDEAPKTGLAIGASVVLSLLAIGGVSLYFYKKSTSKNKFNRL